MRKRVLFIISIIIISLLSVGYLLTGCSAMQESAELSVNDLLTRAALTTTTSGNGKRAIDDSIRSSWQPKSTSSEHITLDMGNELSIDAVILREGHANSVEAFRLQISSDNSEWRTIYLGDDIGDYRLCTFNLVRGRYLRLIIDHASDKIKISDIQAFVGNNQRPITNSAFLDMSLKKATSYTSEESIQLAEYFISGYNELIIGGLVSFTHTGGAAVSSSSRGSVMHNVEASASSFSDTNNSHGSSARRHFNGTYAPNTAGYSSYAPVSDSPTLIAVDREVSYLSALLKDKGVRIGITLEYDMAMGIFSQSEYDRAYAEVMKLAAIGGLSIINLAWSNIPSSGDWRLYNSFIKAVSVSLLASGKTLSITLPASDVKLQLDTVAAINHVYYNGFYSKNYMFSSSDFYSTAYLAAAYLQNIGFSKSQIVLGIPFYGISNNGKPSTIAWKDYANDNPAALWRNTVYNIYYNDTIANYSFNSYALARDKSVYAALLGLGGTAAMNIGDDLPMANDSSLSSAIIR